jgi:hypothetical protein
VFLADLLAVTADKEAGLSTSEDNGEEGYEEDYAEDYDEAE